MQGKEKSEKRDVLKKSAFKAEEVAKVVGCSKSYIKALRRGARPINTPLAEKVVTAEEVLEVGRNTLLEEVEKRLKPL